MSQKEPSEINRWVSLAGIFGALLVFAVVLYVAYLPGRPEPIDTKAAEERKQDADEAHAAGLAKIDEFEMVDKDAGIARIPIEDAMSLTVDDYRVSEGAEN